MRTWLLDAGPILVLLDARAPDYEPVRSAMEQFRGQLVTTSSVITEVFHLVRRSAHGPERVLQFLKASGTTVRECCHPDDLRSAVALMGQYKDTPMDFADATLVLLADTLGQYQICTLDRRGFNTFRTPKGKRFSLVIDES